MTREELRDYVEEQGNLKNIPYHVYSALIDGIDTLEQEPTTKNDLAVDAISRADARSLISDIDLKYHMSGMSRKAFKDLYNGMDELPSVTPIRPKGHWIWCGGSHKCSNCEEYTCFSHKVRYCPNCGADMRTSED